MLGRLENIYVSVIGNMKMEALGDKRRSGERLYICFGDCAQENRYVDDSYVWHCVFSSLMDVFSKPWIRIDECANQAGRVSS